MKLDKKKIQNMSEEEAQALLDQFTGPEIEPGNITLSKASQAILFEEAAAAQKDIDEIREFHKGGK